jgi:hypothetical protein
VLIADEPLLALILRFVADADARDEADDAFIREQIQALRAYVAGFPQEEQGERAMEWIERHAEGYRQRWQRREVSRRTLHQRCADCPLRKLRAEEHCEIHEQWLYLLKRYIDGEVTSKKYVKRLLRLLKRHKKQLKLRVKRRPGRPFGPLAP